MRARPFMAGLATIAAFSLAMPAPTAGQAIPPPPGHSLSVQRAEPYETIDGLALSADGTRVVFNVQPSDFDLQLNPSSGVITDPCPPQTDIFGIGVVAESTAGMPEPVRLDVTPPPNTSGFSFQFSTKDVRSGETLHPSTLTITIDTGKTANGTYLITVTGIGSSHQLQHSATFTLQYTKMCVVPK